jgi:exopolysaccharide biosynthesis polyprenyl glycosylphosphotransferase
MKDDPIKTELIKRFTTAQSPWGRFRLAVYARWKRIAWRWVIGSTLAIKRLFDVVVSVTFLIMFSPVYAVLALLIKLEDRGPVFFAQTRVGLHGREFKMLKYRSMCVNAEAKLQEILAKNQHQQGVTFKMKDDPRITKVGKWLRKLSLDELPQMINVLQGAMSLVGPRPPVPREVALYSQSDRLRLNIKPGITCFWQIGGRSEIDFSGQVKLDVKYIESQSFWTDIMILLKTVPAVLFGKGAY